MLDLEKQIANWRQEMSKTGCRDEVLNELEEHLREEVERLGRSGVPADKAFEIAASKLGTPSAMATEFRKLPSLRPWMPVRLACLGTTALVVALLGYGMVQVASHGGILLGAHVFGITLGYVLMFIIGGLAVCSIGARWFGEFSAAQRSSLFRSMFRFAHASAIFTILGIVLGVFWAKENLGRYWGWDAKEVGAFLILCWAVLLSVLSWFKPGEATVLCLAILGNLVTAWGWFGGNAQFTAPFSPYLIVFSASQLIIVLAVALNHLQALQQRDSE